MKPIYICVAGPQSSGKSEAIKFLSQKFKDIRPHQEINPFIIASSSHLGGVFAGKNLERKIIKADLKRLFWLSKTKREVIHLVETGLFHLVYAQEKLGQEEFKEFKKEYQNLLKKLKTGVFFTDTKPQISWARRRGYYLKRTIAEIKKQGLIGVEAKRLRDKMIRKYKERIFALYPLWLEMFESLPYPKVKIPNNGRSLESFRKKVIDGFLKLTKKMSISVKA